MGFGEILSGFAIQNVGRLFVTAVVVIGVGSRYFFFLSSMVPRGTRITMSVSASWWSP